MTKKISRAQWNQIHKRVKQADFKFDPSWKCLIDGLSYRLCLEHNEEDQADIIKEVRVRFAAQSS